MQIINSQPFPIEAALATETIQPNDQILLDAFECFLANAHGFYQEASRYTVNQSKIDDCLSELLQKPGYMLQSLRWHFCVVISEFIIAPSIAASYFADFPFSGENCLNWRGKKLYRDLKNRIKEHPNQR